MQESVFCARGVHTEPSQTAFLSRMAWIQIGGQRICTHTARPKRKISSSKTLEHGMAAALLNARLSLTPYLCNSLRKLLFARYALQLPTEAVCGEFRERFCWKSGA